MASIIIRNLDDMLKSRLRVRAAYNGRSMEDEVRHILRGTLGDAGQDAINAAKAVSAVTVESGQATRLEPTPETVQDPLEFD